MSDATTKMPEKLHLVRDLLDKLLVDPNLEPLGRADGITLIEQEDGEMRVARIECGAPVLASRISARLGRCVRLLGERFGLRRGTPVRFAMGKVRSTGIQIVIDISADRSLTLAWERWFRNHLTRHIPSFKSK